MTADYFGRPGQGEELWLLEQFPEPGYAVELGAYDGIYGSTTYQLEQVGWKVLCVEPNPRFQVQLLKNRKLVWGGACSDHKGRERFHILDPAPACYSSLRPDKQRATSIGPFNEESWTETEVAVDTLDHLLERYQFPRVDCATIDTEGTELDVLKGFDLDRWQVKALVVESWDAQNEIVPYLAERGFHRVERRLVNDLFIRLGDK
jgi:FkbM family methyltransferase